MSSSLTTNDRSRLAALLSDVILGALSDGRDPAKRAEEAAKAFIAGMAAAPRPVPETFDSDAWTQIFYDTLGIPASLLSKSANATLAAASPASQQPSAPQPEASPMSHPGFPETHPKDPSVVHALLRLAALRRDVEQVMRDLSGSR